MACSAGPAMQVTHLSGATDVFASGCARNLPNARSKRQENRIKSPDRFGLSSNHHTIATLETPDAAARADINVMYLPGSQFPCAPNVVDVIGIAAIDKSVSGFHGGLNFADHVIHHRGWNHEPNRARSLQLA